MTILMSETAGTNTLVTAAAPLSLKASPVYSDTLVT